MFEYFEGTITCIQPSYIVVDCNGIGYKLLCPSPYSYNQGQRAKIFVEQIVRDNGIDLYGFSSEDAKKLFLKLISVSGIGPKSALAIMAAEDNEALADAIEQGEVKYLTKFPGVGKKTASQIILDLKGKMKEFTNRIDQTNQDDSNLSPQLQDALAALLALGYTQRDIKRITGKLADMKLKSAADYTKAGLKLLLKK